MVELQNSESSIVLLAAQRQMYQTGKLVQRCRSFLTVILAVASPLLLVIVPGSKSIMAPASGLWLLVSRLLLEELELTQIRKAANVQEQFDCGLFGLTWNSFLAGARIPLESINAAARRYRGDKTELRDWYTFTGRLPRTQQVLACQMSNLSWDGRLRRNYAIFVFSLTVLLLVAGILVGIILNATLVDYLLAILFPSLPALLKGIEIAKGHSSLARRKTALHSSLAELLASCLSRGKVAQVIHRQVQDTVYRLRCERPIVPDYWYRLFRSGFQKDTDYFNNTLCGRQSS